MKRALEGREKEFNQTGKLSSILEFVGASHVEKQPS